MIQIELSIKLEAILEKHYMKAWFNLKSTLAPFKIKFNI